jgi:hypothetical protein
MEKRAMSREARRVARAIGDRLSYANVMATIAVFGVLGGGGAYAASKIGAGDIARNAVRSKHIKKNAVRSKHVKKNAVRPRHIKTTAVKTRKIANGAVTEAKLADGVGGLRGPQGPQGPPGSKGDQGNPGPFPGTLPSGKTIKGYYMVRATAAQAGDFAGDAIAFGFTLPSPPIEHFLVEGATTPECQGSDDAPTAAPGHLCVYEGSPFNRDTPIIVDADGFAGAEPFGAGIVVDATAAGNFASAGSWAVTSP